MKKLLLTLTFGFTVLAAQAQTKITVKTDTLKTTINGKNELKINLLSTLFSLPEISYERLIANDMSVGVSVMFRLEDDTDINFGIVPNYRIYFGAKKAAGFFVEGNAAIINSKNDYYLSYSSYPAGQALSYKNETNLGLGLAVGGKFLTKSGLVVETYLGLGRVFGNNNLDAYPRVGISIGKRL